MIVVMHPVGGQCLPRNDYLADVLSPVFSLHAAAGAGAFKIRLRAVERRVIQLPPLIHGKLDVTRREVVMKALCKEQARASSSDGSVVLLAEHEGAHHVGTRSGVSTLGHEKR